jgi:histidinol-phosphatase (PHP family)
MTIDLHNHTKLCNHATGELREYIERAIATDTDILGVSDHAPMEFDETYRMKFGEMRDYESLVKELKAEYKDKIAIKLAYEVDFLDGHISQKVLDADVDYLIGSVHFVKGWGFDNPEFIGDYANHDLDQLWSEYFGAIKELAESGLFNIVGHLDLLKIFKFLPSRPIRELVLPALEAIKNAGMAVEINTAGFRKPIAEQYPCVNILQEVRRLGIPITFGSDSHAPSQVGMNRQKAFDLARELGFEEVATFENRKMKLVKF